MVQSVIISIRVNLSLIMWGHGSQHLYLLLIIYYLYQTNSSWDVQHKYWQVSFPNKDRRVKCQLSMNSHHIFLLTNRVCRQHHCRIQLQLNYSSIISTFAFLLLTYPNNIFLLLPLLVMLPFRPIISIY